MANPSKRKGDQFERDCVAFLNSQGLTARRQPYSGALNNWKGDIQFMLNGEKQKAECKRRKGAYKGINDALGANFVLFVKDDRTPALAVMRLEDFGKLVGGK
jgi:Holliday junction resolvase